MVTCERISMAKKDSSKFDRSKTPMPAPTISVYFHWDLFLGMARAGARFRVLDRRWAAYRMHEINKTAADPARRRLEIAEMLRREFGAASPQHLWARLVWLGFALSERTDIRLLKSGTAVANTWMKKLTRCRVWSS
jgi:hypothetical protein